MPYDTDPDDVEIIVNAQWKFPVPKDLIKFKNLDSSLEDEQLPDTFRPSDPDFSFGVEPLDPNDFYKASLLV